MLRIGGSAATQSSCRRKRRYRRFSKSEITTFVSFVAFCKNSLRCIHLSFYRRKRSQGRACISTERKFKLRFPPRGIFTEGSEANEGPQQETIFVLFVIFCSNCFLPPGNFYRRKRRK